MQYVCVNNKNKNSKPQTQTTLHNRDERERKKEQYCAGKKNHLLRTQCPSNKDSRANMSSKLQ